MSVLTIGTDNFNVYGTIAALTSYANGSFGSNAVKWRALASDDKSRTLVAASVMLDEQFWQGTATTPGQAQDWPRSGVIDRTGASVDPTTVPALVVQAAYELAMMIAGDPSVQFAASTGSNISSVQAGPVNIHYFLPTQTAAAGATRLPSRIMDLVGDLLQSAGDSTGGFASGTSCESAFTDCEIESRKWSF